LFVSPEEDVMNFVKFDLDGTEDAEEKASREAADRMQRLKDQDRDDRFLQAEMEDFRRERRLRLVVPEVEPEADAPDGLFIDVNGTPHSVDWVHTPVTGSIVTLREDEDGYNIV
jgi:hypothetical protein